MQPVEQRPVADGTYRHRPAAARVLAVARLVRQAAERALVVGAGAQIVPAGRGQRLRQDGDLVQRALQVGPRRVDGRGSGRMIHRRPHRRGGGVARAIHAQHHAVGIPRERHGQPTVHVHFVADGRPEVAAGQLHREPVHRGRPGALERQRPDAQDLGRARRGRRIDAHEEQHRVRRRQVDNRRTGHRAVGCLEGGAVGHGAVRRLERALHVPVRAVDTVAAARAGVSGRKGAAIVQSPVEPGVARFDRRPPAAPRMVDRDGRPKRRQVLPAQVRVEQAAAGQRERRSTREREGRRAVPEHLPGRVGQPDRAGGPLTDLGRYRDAGLRYAAAAGQRDFLAVDLDPHGPDPT